MKRDLTAYFRETTGREVSIEYDLLREAPTQSGLAYPKFYLWVRILNDESMLERGAVRVLAIARNNFEVTDYLSEKAINEQPKLIYDVFPALICEEIEERIGRRCSTRVVYVGSAMV